MRSPFQSLSCIKGNPKRLWFGIWQASSSEDRPPIWIFEAYPSLFWKKILGIRRRNSQDLIHYLKSQPPGKLEVGSQNYQLLAGDHDLCDSLVLAVSSLELQAKKKLWNLPDSIPDLDQEGWILGLEI